MKCIRCIKTGEVTRVSNVAAFKAVNNGTHEYIPKQEWKEAGRP